MAVVCVSTITPVDIPNKKVKISAVITNDAEPSITVTMEEADISTQENKIVAANIIWEKFVAKRNKYLAEQAIGQELTDLQTALDNTIQGRTS